MKQFLLKIRANFFRWLHRPRMLNNIYINQDGTLSKNTRFSSNVSFVNVDKISLGNNVYIGNNVILDGTGGLVIDEGCQISARTSILTHSSHNAIRLFGKHYKQCKGVKEEGYIIGEVKLGKYTFIGTNTIIVPNITIGKGCVVGANSFVNKNLPDYSIAVGSPIKIIASTKDLDSKYLQNNKQFQEYYNEWNND
ncbi:MAG: hypothetical protein DRG78_10530 [Epsilonproteobacteria bacterium]|nr:MAG: hypothetical protein DRG78_10530 [Campylobacterota bacterium]